MAFSKAPLTRCFDLKPSDHPGPGSYDPHHKSDHARMVSFPRGHRFTTQEGAHLDRSYVLDRQSILSHAPHTYSVNMSCRLRGPYANNSTMGSNSTIHDSEDSYLHNTSVYYTPRDPQSREPQSSTTVPTNLSPLFSEAQNSEQRLAEASRVVLEELNTAISTALFRFQEFKSSQNIRFEAKMASCRRKELTIWNALPKVREVIDQKRRQKEMQETTNESRRINELHQAKASNAAAVERLKIGMVSEAVASVKRINQRSDVGISRLSSCEERFERVTLACRNLHAELFDSKNLITTAMERMLSETAEKLRSLQDRNTQIVAEKMQSHKADRINWETDRKATDAFGSRRQQDFKMWTCEKAKHADCTSDNVELTLAALDKRIEESSIRESDCSEQKRLIVDLAQNLYKVVIRKFSEVLRRISAFSFSMEEISVKVEFQKQRNRSKMLEIESCSRKLKKQRSQLVVVHQQSKQFCEEFTKKSGERKDAVREKETAAASLERKKLDIAKQEKEQATVESVKEERFNILNKEKEQLESAKQDKAKAAALLHRHQAELETLLNDQAAKKREELKRQVDSDSTKLSLLIGHTNKNQNIKQTEEYVQGVKGFKEKNAMLDIQVKKLREELGTLKIGSVL